MKPRPEFEFFTGEDGQFYWRLKAANGEIVASSEGYETKPDSVRGARDMVATVLAVVSNFYQAVAAPVFPGEEETEDDS